MRTFLISLLVLAAIFFSILLGEIVFERLYVYPKVSFGVTFSPGYAKYLNLNWQKTYNAILDNLKVKNLRIMTYWDILQPDEGRYDFSETDYMLDEAGKRGARVILVVGVRQPRWPECYIPAWAKGLTVVERQQKILGFIQKTVERYKDNPAVWAWQVENEPLLSFGENCDATSKNFLRQEVTLVRSLSKKVIIMTDSGELGFWITSMQMSDIFGTTVYRQVYDKWLGYMTYPISPSFYSLKSNFIRYLFARSNQKTIIVEFQAEPWLADGTLILPDQQAKIFTLGDFKNYINFVGKTGFDEAYLWGIEWWYFMASKGHPEYLEYAKVLF